MFDNNHTQSVSNTSSAKSLITPVNAEIKKRRVSQNTNRFGHETDRYSATKAGVQKSFSEKSLESVRTVLVHRNMKKDDSAQQLI